MSITINVNSLSLCHKASGGIIKNTLPDFCKTPDKCIPLPYQITSFSRDLVKGTTSVEADGGNMCAILGSEFSKCIGDEAGSCGGIISGTNLKEATWITYSPDVFMEGKPVCRLTDKMWMNHGNTVALGGLNQPPVISANNLTEYLCGIICECAEAGRQVCMDRKIESDWYELKKMHEGGKTTLYPKDFDDGVLREVSMKIENNGKWGIIKDSTGTTQTSNPITPLGGIRPDVVLRNGGKTTKIVEVKFRGDVLRPSQNPYNRNSKYNRAASDLGVKYQLLKEEDCSCNNGEDEKSPVTEPAPIPAREEENSSIGEYALIGLGGLAAVAACIFGGCEAAAAALLGGSIIAAAGA